MTNEEYIKSLELRIENLEKALETITNSKSLKNQEDITVKDSNLTTLSLIKCKNIYLENNKIEAGVFTALKNKFSHLKIGKAEIVKSKVKFKNCSFDDVNKKE